MPTIARSGVVTITPKMPACRSTGMGPGGVKINSTSSTGKIGTTGRSFMGRGGTRPANDAAFLEQRVYTLFGRLAAPTFLTPKITAVVAKALGVNIGKRHVESTVPDMRRPVHEPLA